MRDQEGSLIAKAKEGDRDAFGELYDEYMPKIYRFVLLRTGHVEDAEDLTHHVFLSAWENVGRYEERGLPFSSWLYRIAVNAVIDHYRTRKPTVSVDAVPEDRFAEPSRVGDEVDTALSLERVRATLLKLEPDQQNVLVMRYVEDLSTKEIADALGKTEGAVRVIQHRALKRVKELTNADGIHRTTKEV